MAGCVLYNPVETKISRGTEIRISEVRPNLFCFTGNVFFQLYKRLLKILSKELELNRRKKVMRSK